MHTCANFISPVAPHEFAVLAPCLPPASRIHSHLFAGPSPHSSRSGGSSYSRNGTRELQCLSRSQKALLPAACTRAGVARVFAASQLPSVVTGQVRHSLALYGHSFLNVSFVLLC